MYRLTKNNNYDMNALSELYSNITSDISKGKIKRTKKQHQWEWFGSPYKNKSYTVLNDNEEIVGHHGILTIYLHYNNVIYTVGKTANTMSKEGFGPLCVKCELDTHKDYFYEYDTLVTTFARGSAIRIRKQLGYSTLGTYVSFIRIVDYSFLSNATYIDFISELSLVDKKYFEKINNVNINDLKEIESFYNAIKNDLGYSQNRNQEFLNYRTLNNPYIKYGILKLYDGNRMCGYILFYLRNKSVMIEDILFLNHIIKEELLNRLFNFIKINKLGYAIEMIVLENSLLDTQYENFTRVRRRSLANVSFMYKNNKIEDDFNVKNFYFTKLIFEGSW